MTLAMVLTAAAFKIVINSWVPAVRAPYHQLVCSAALLGRAWPAVVAAAAPNLQQAAPQPKSCPPPQVSYLTTLDGYAIVCLAYIVR